MKDQPLLIGIKVSRNVKDQICSEVRMRDVSPKTLESRLNAARAVMRHDEVKYVETGRIKYIDEKGDYVVGEITGIKTGEDKPNYSYSEHHRIVGFDLRPTEPELAQIINHIYECYISMGGRIIIYHVDSFGIRSFGIFDTVRNRLFTLAADALVREGNRIFSIHNGTVKGWQYTRMPKRLR